MPGTSDLTPGMDSETDLARSIRVLLISADVEFGGASRNSPRDAGSPRLSKASTVRPGASRDVPTPTTQIQLNCESPAWSWVEIYRERNSPIRN